jgi:hypothetical protein
MFPQSADDVYLAPRQRRPSFDQFVETSFQDHWTTPANTEDFPAAEFDEVHHSSSMIPDETGSELSELESPEDRADTLCNRVFTEKMDEIGDSGDDAEYSDPEQSTLDDQTFATACPGSTREQTIMRSSRSRRRLFDDVSEQDEQPEVKRRELRSRTANQINPYKVDQIKYATKNKLGKDANSSEIEDEVLKSTQQVISKTNCPGKKRQPTSNNRRPRASTRKTSRTASAESTLVEKRSVSSTPIRPDESASIVKVTVKTEYTKDEKLEKTTLFTYLKDEEAAGAAPIGLDHCSSLEILIDFVKGCWGHKGGQFDSLQCVLPWKEENQTILIREKMNYSFEHMMKEILNAPAWAEGAERLEVQLVVAFIIV